MFDMHRLPRMTKEVCRETAGPHMLECFKERPVIAHALISGTLYNSCFFI